MDDMLDSLTKKGRKLKKRLRGKKNKPDKTGANTTEENINSSSLLLQPVPHIATGSHDGAGSGISTDERQIRSRDGSPQPESVSVGRREADVDEKEMSKGHSRPNADADVVEGSEPGREAEHVHSSIKPFDPAHRGARKYGNAFIFDAASDYSLGKHRHRCS